MTIHRLHKEPLQDAWLDAYGHLNEAYYLVPFSNATWKLQDAFGVGTDYFDATGCALYTVETHLRYLDEVRAPANLEIASMILGIDEKKLQIAHVMEFEGRERATFECLLLHFDTRAGKTAPFPAEALEKMKAAVVDPTPDWAGRSVKQLGR
ncbi:thioesterase family protein [Marivibrio halodurans]|uniref:Thioesterase family protein n=1 Tax=Marivibrio halodurans TaxID=2039722 RepID=A0A8J7V2H4_9PROT|nr:thioesterase family protein [Marivibrio halodurans]MBP5855769.1 thioesterase family protein [Marivibrio halodurans]